MNSDINVYTSGQDGYHTYRIPALLAAPNGDLLAFCEGRRNNQRDHGDIDLLVKRSSDGGATWSEQSVIYGEPGDVTIGNPCPVVDQDTGTIWLPFCRENHDVLITRSDDNGRTWSTPIDISASATRESWNWYATGPGVGIQLQTGTHPGRLVIPCDHRNDSEYGNGSHALYSDDHGETWQVSEVIQPGANECQVVELSDGTLMMNIRMQTISEGYRGVATSADGGQTWSNFRHERQLPCPKCQASLVTNGETLLFSNPVPSSDPSPDKGERVHLVVRRSDDAGHTWSDVAELHHGPAAYSSLVFLSGSEAACLFEGGDEHFRERLVFKTFPIA